MKIDFESRFEMRMSIFYSKFFSELLGQYLKKSKNGFPLVFSKSELLWQGSIEEIDYGVFRVFGSYFIGKSLGTFKF